MSSSSADRECRLGEMTGGIVCGCMPMLPQFFRHFVPKIATAFSSSRRSSGRGKSNEFSASTEHSAQTRSSKPRYPKSPYGDTESYVELDERKHQFKPIDGLKEGLRVWSDEVSSSDEEKALPAVAGDGIASVVRH